VTGRAYYRYMLPARTTSDPVLNITENNSSDFENDLIYANGNNSKN